MGFDFGLDRTDVCYKRKFRWLLKIDGVSAQGVDALPPSKAARPSMSFKESEVQHLTETLYYPSKPEWKPITLTIYDLKRNKHPVWEWLKLVYDPSASTNNWQASGDGEFKKDAIIELYDGCGTTIERWTIENAWPQAVEFGELDMGANDVITADITLRYDRAYIEYV